MQVVVLVTSENSQFVQELARNYPHLESLCISQSQPMNSSAVLALRSFTKMEALELHFPVLEPTELGANIPVDVEDLTLTRTLLLPKLSHLESIHLKKCDVGNFLETLDAPNLVSLNLIDVQIDHNTLVQLNRFPKLQYFMLTNITEDDLEKIRSYTKAKVTNNRQFLRTPPPLPLHGL